MTNLPIASNNSPLPGNTLNAVQAGLPVDDPIAGLFAALLAQQTGVDDSLPPGNAQLVITIDGIAADGGTDPTTTIDAGEQAVILADTQGDAANGLAAMLLQLPQASCAQESQIRIAGDTANIQNLPAGSRKTADIATLRSDSSPDAKPDMADLARDKANMMTATPGKQSLSEAAGKDALKHAELTAVSPNTTQLTQNTTQLTPNTAQLLAPPAAMANLLTGSRNADNPQTIGTPLASAGWASEFSQKVVWMGTQQNQIAELHLNPPDLGPLNVSLKISDNQATALFTSPHGAVRDAIENALPKLREMLADNGITLGNATVNDQSPRERNAERFMNQNSAMDAQPALDHVTSIPATAQNGPVRRHNGMVDTFA